MSYAERHRKDKSLEGEKSGMVKKPIDGLEYTDMIDFEEPESSDNFNGRKGKVD